MTRKASILILFLNFIFISFSAYSETEGEINQERRSPFQVDNIPKPLTGSNNISDELFPLTSVDEKVDNLIQISLTLNKDKLLSQEIQTWAEKYGLRPLWNSSRDYIIYNSITLTGKTTDDVLAQLGQVFASEHYGLIIKLYEKNNVLVIDAE